MLERTLRLIFIAVLAAGCGNESSAPSGNDVVTDTHAVGSTTIFIHDDTRPYDNVAGIDTGMRTLITEIWYPVHHDDAASGDYRRVCLLCYLR